MKNKKVFGWLQKKLSKFFAGPGRQKLELPAEKKDFLSRDPEVTTRMLTTLLSNLPGIVYRCKRDKSWTMEYISEGCKKLTGYAPEEILGNNKLAYGELIHGDDREKVWQEVQKNVARGQPFKITYRIKTRDKKIKWVWEQGRAVYDSDGEEYLEGFITDITRRKEMEINLRRERRRFERTVEEAPFPIMLHTEDGEVIHINKAWSDITGYSPGDIPTISEWTARAYGDRQEEIKKKIRDLHQQEGIIREGEFVITTGEGEERIWDFESTGLDSLPDGRKLMISIASDVTERRRIEERERHLKQVLQGIRRVNQLIVKESDPEILVRDACHNLTESLGYSRAWIVLFSGEGKVTQVVSSNFDGVFGEFRERLHEGKFPYCIRAALRKKELIVINNPLQRCGDCLLASKYSGRGMLANVLFHENKVYGVLTVTIPEKYLNLEREHYFFREVAEDLGFALYKIELEEERERVREEIKYMNFHDRLTDLYNRTFLEEEINRLDVERKLPISLIMADLNGLKLINDTYGHEKGDEILIKTADILRESCRREDIIARWGGDEFVLFLPETGEEEARRICSRINSSCENTGNEEIPISLALGMGIKREGGEDVYNVLRRAEEQMYKNKLVESRSAKNNILKALLNTLGAKSHETEEHAWRMQKMALELGQEIALSHSELERLSLLATLHDIGKTIIPERILTKPGELNEEEWDTVKEHPVTGNRIAKATEEFAHIAEEILAHHERWDGEGYPRGLEKDNIPLLARVISIVDAFDVMTNGRPYKQALSEKEALGELERCAGTQFDPGLVEKFIAIRKNRS